MHQAKSPRTPTLATTLVDRLRADIVRGTLAPGEKLRLEMLAERYGVGRSPLREAFCRLASEGLVLIEDQRGFRVAPISRHDLLDLTRTRQQIEGLALRASVAQGGLEWEGELMASFHRLSRLRAHRAGDPRVVDDDWSAEHRVFHTVLVSACDSPWLLRFREMLFDQSERYRRLSMGDGTPSRDVAEEHAALVRAAVARDADRACALLTEHLARTADAVLARYSAEAPAVRGTAAKRTRVPVVSR
jgi:DNA-binding GntR family transcriptional regulator